MTKEQKFMEDYNIGQNIFKKLYDLKKEDFIIIMKDMFQDNKNVMEILEDNPKLNKTLIDDTPQTICIYYYSSLEINWSGVKYKPEHGESKTLIKFDKYFNIDNALKLI